MSEDLIAGIVRILTAADATVGTGFVITDDGLIATCAHVVEAGGAGPGDTVRVAFHTTGQEREAQVEPSWWRGPDVEDIAILRLTSPLPEGVASLPLGVSIGSEGHAFKTFGFPEPNPVEGLRGSGHILGETALEGMRVLQVRSQEVAQGMSGAPLWDVEAERIVGMLTRTYHTDATLKFRDLGFAIPTEVLVEVCPAPLVLHPLDSADLPPLSENPRTTRFQHDHALVGRDTELAWLWQLDGDGLLIGQPGSGKTFLLRKFALEGGGLFVTSDDRADIAAFLSARHPNVVILDDAHVRAEPLVDLKHIRAELGHSFQILATCWPGDEAALRNALVLPESRVCRLGLLTRPEIVEVIKATGLGGPNELIREIVNQAEGRPGLAMTLAYLSLQGDVRRVLLGDVLSNTFLEAFESRIGKTAREILAAFAVGGEVGMPLDIVAEQLELPPLDVRQAVVDLAAGGVILETGPQHLSVRPPALRHVLIRDVFLCGPTALPFSVLQGLLARSPNRAQSTQALIGAKARGGEISSAWLAELVESIGTPHLWRLYVQLGREEATWVFENHPEALTSAAPLGLELAPDTALPLLLTRAIGDERPLYVHPDHPLRIIQDWVLVGEPGSGQPVERRRILLQGVRSWLAQGYDESIGLHALRFVLSPNFQSHTSDPGSGNTITIRRGLLSPDELRAVQEPWPQVLEILQTTQVTDWEPVRRMVEAWVYPGRFNVRVSSEASEVINTFAVRLLRNLVPLIESHPGLCHWAKRISGHLRLDLQIPSYEVFETLYPLEDVHDVDQFRSVHNQQAQAVRELAHQWRQRDPVRVVQDLLIRA